MLQAKAFAVCIKNNFYYNFKMSKEINVTQILRIPININGIDLEKMFIYDKFGFDKIGRK